MEQSNPTTPSDLRRLLEIRMNETSRLSAIIRMIQYGAFFVVLAIAIKFIPEFIQKFLWMPLYVIIGIVYLYLIYDYMIRDHADFNRYYVSSPNVDNL